MVHKANLDNNCGQLAEESDRSLHVLSTKTNSTAQHTAQHITSTRVVRDASVGNRKSQSANMVGEHAVGTIDVVYIIGTQLWETTKKMDILVDRAS